MMLFVMTRVRRHYDSVGTEIASQDPVDFKQLLAPLVITPISGWSRISQKALRCAYDFSHEIRAVYVAADEEANCAFCQDWARLAEAPAKAAGLPPPELVVLESPYRWVLRPIVDYVLEVEKQNPNREIVVVLSEMVERHWYHYFLHNQRAEILKTWLLVRGSQRIIIVNVPWYLKV
jgi:hypothetical protein